MKKKKQELTIEEFEGGRSLPLGCCELGFENSPPSTQITKP